MKINAVAQLYSGKQLVNEVEDITGQKINHVALIQFGGLVKVVDALGGVELCYDQDVDDPYSSLNWTAGCHTVDGNTALAFSRMRYADAQGRVPTDPDELRQGQNRGPGRIEFRDGG